MFDAAGNPFGSGQARLAGTMPDEAALAAARHRRRRVAEKAALLRPGW